MRGPHPGKVQLEGFPPFEIYLDRRIKAAAARALAQIAPKDPRSVAALALLMERTDMAERLAAVAAARHTGAAGAALLPQLMRMAANDAPLIRREAITTLGTLGPVAAPAADLLERLSGDPDPQIAKRAQAALRQIRQ